MYHMDNNQKGIILSASCESTEEYFYQYVRTLRGTADKVSIRVISVWFIFVGILSFKSGTTSDIIIGAFLLIGAIYFWYIYSSHYISVLYNSYRMSHGVTLRFEFNDSYVRVSDKFGNNTIPYNLLYAIKQSKYGFVLCVSKASGYFIPKGVCSNDLISFIENLKNIK